jgi:hypothetical protein
MDSEEYGQEELGGTSDKNLKQITEYTWSKRMRNDVESNLV